MAGINDAYTVSFWYLTNKGIGMSHIILKQLCRY